MIPVRGNTTINGLTLIGFSKGIFLFVSNFAPYYDRTSYATTRHVNICRAVTFEADTEFLTTAVAARFYNLICWNAIKQVGPRSKVFYIDKTQTLKCKLLAVPDLNDTEVKVVYRNRKRIKTVGVGTNSMVVQANLTTKPLCKLTTFLGVNE